MTLSSITCYKPVSSLVKVVLSILLRGLVNFLEQSRKLLFTHCDDTQSFHVAKTRFTSSVRLCINADELSCFFYAALHFVFQSVFFSRHLSWLHSNKVTNSPYCAARQHRFEH